MTGQRHPHDTPKWGEKQLKALAEWMGRTGTIDRMDNPMWREQFARYLLGNDGQAALMDKLIGGGSVVYLFRNIEDTSGKIITCTIASGRNKNYIETGGTRQEALINAVLKMLGVTE